MTANDAPKGDCYEANAMFIVNLARQFPENKRELKRYRLVHGKVLGAEGSPVAGTWIDHAWIELDGKIVIDASNGKLITLPIERIQHRMKLTEARRYTVKQAVFLMLKTEHYGEWNDAERAEVIR